MEPEGARRLLATEDPLRDVEVVANRLLRIHEAERIRQVLRDADIPCQLRLLKPGAVHGMSQMRPDDPWLDSEYSTIRPSWNVVVPKEEVARARALVEEALHRDIDGRDDTAEIAAGTARPQPVLLVMLPWAEAWDLVEELGRHGIAAAVGAPPGDGMLEERDAPVLVRPSDLEYATKLVPPAEA
jgi:hypothetical protein